MNNIATYLLLRRDASVITSGRSKCYVGTYFQQGCGLFLTASAEALNLVDTLE